MAHFVINHSTEHIHPLTYPPTHTMCYRFWGKEDAKAHQSLTRLINHRGRWHTSSSTTTRAPTSSTSRGTGSRSTTPSAASGATRVGGWKRGRGTEGKWGGICLSALLTYRWMHTPIITTHSIHTPQASRGTASTTRGSWPSSPTRRSVVSIHTHIHICIVDMFHI